MMSFSRLRRGLDSVEASMSGGRWSTKRGWRATMSMMTSGDGRRRKEVEGMAGEQSQQFQTSMKLKRNMKKMRRRMTMMTGMYPSMICGGMMMMTTVKTRMRARR